MIGLQRIVEGCIDLDRIEIFREISRFMECGRPVLGIENTVPVCIGPAGWSHSHYVCVPLHILIRNVHGLEKSDEKVL
jgi:hypothetical protein